MSSQDQDYNEMTQITKSGRKLKYGLLFVNENVPNDQLINIEVRQMEDGLSLTEVKQRSDRELYIEIFDRMVQIYNKLCYNKKKKLNDQNFSNFCNQMKPLRQNELTSVEAIMNLEQYQNFGKNKMNNLQECIDHFFDTRNKDNYKEFINMLHKSNKLIKILKDMPVISRKIVLEEYNKQIEIAQLEHQKSLLQQQLNQLSNTKNKQSSNTLQNRHFSIDLLSSSSSEQPSSIKSTSCSPNRIYPANNSKILQQNFASERRQSMKERKQRNNNDENLKCITIEQGYQQKKKNNKVSFANDIIDKEESNQIFKQQNSCAFEWCNNNINQKESICINEKSKLCNANIFKKVKKNNNNYKATDKLFCVPNIEGQQQVNDQGYNLIKYEDQQYDQKYMNQQCQAQQLPSFNNQKYDARFFQSNQNDAINNLLIKPIPFNQSGILNFTSIQNRCKISNEMAINSTSSNFLNLKLNKDAKMQVELLLPNRKTIEFSDSEDISTNKLQKKKDQAQDNNLDNQTQVNQNIKMLNKNCIYMTDQKNEQKYQNENPFKSLQKTQINQKKSSNDRTQTSSKFGSQSSQTSSNSQLKVGSKLKIQSFGKISVISQICKQTQIQYIEDDIEEVVKKKR